MRTISSLIYHTVFAGSLLLWSNLLNAQVKAGFSATSAAGCSPLVVKFTDESTGNPTSWRWDLGNGTISFLQHPAATYFNPGTYTIKLVVHNGTQADSIVKVGYVTVYAPPVVNFSASDTTGCFPLKVQFTDLSSAGDGTIVSREWDFGDGTVSTEAHPEHRYTAAGKYTVSLRVRNSYGCTQTFTRTQYIQLANGVKADFGFTVPNSCKPPTAVRFTNKSTGTGTLSYVWDFGDGSTSTDLNPVHTYTVAGTYSVTLRVRNNTGCSDSVVKVNAINIGTVKAGFSVPALICSDAPFVLTNNTTPAPVGALWYFGDGTTATELSPVKTYTQPGTYTIKLVSDFGACKDSTTQAIRVVAKTKAAFMANDSTACQAPFAVNFTATAGAAGYQWLFGDGGRDTGVQVSHTYQANGEYDVTLIVTNAAGCTDTLVKKQYIQIKAPQVSLTNGQQEGCLPFTWQPAFTVNAVEPLVNYVWHFGDGATATGPNPTHTYTQPGTYTVKLVYTTASDCTDSISVADAIRTGTKPVVSFTAAPREVCAFQPVQFTDGSTGGKADRWLWHFGDGSTAAEQHPTHIYQDTGSFTIKLVVWSNGCQDSLTIPRYVHIKPPIARFITAAVDCNVKFTRRFTDQSIGATSWYWNFGDGNTSTERHPVHTYSNPGSYIATLTVKNATCEHTTSRQVVIVSEKADFTASATEVCKNVPITLSAVNSQAQNISSYAWTISKGNTTYGTPTGRNVPFTFPAAGQYTIRLIIKDIYGCPDTLTRPLFIKVNGPTADFSVINPEVCTNTTIQFADSSQSDGEHPIQQWQWNYGDGVVETLTAGGPFQHTYTKSGIYPVQLTVTDNLGCTDTRTIQHAVTISRPVVQFTSPDTLSCTGAQVRFVNQTSGNSPVYTWYFGDGETTAATQPAHIYAQEGDYTIKLVANDRFGCADSLTKQQYVRIRDPRAIFSMSDSFATCPPLRVNFTNQSLHFNRIEWDFGDGNKSTLANPSHYYTYPGVYRAKLTITSPGGCVDSLIKIITVKGPQGAFTYDKTSGCVPTVVGFTAKTNQDVSLVWDYNDGTVDETDNTTITHTFTTMGEYLPKLILIDAQGCRVPVLGIDTIRVYGVNADFTSSEALLCDSGQVQFTNTSVSNDLITRYNWSFGDGGTSAEKSPVHAYQQSGQYTPQLTVTTQNGCTGIARQPLPLKIVQSPYAAIEGDTAACTPAMLQFRGSLLRADTSQVQWQWDFGNGTTAQVQNPGAVNYTTAGAYTSRLIVTNSSGCADTVLKTVHAWPIPAVNAGADQAICRNNAITLTGTGASEYTWFPATALSCTNCPAPLASPLEDITYIVTGKNNYGCVATDSIRIEVKQPFTMEVGKGDTLCKGETFQLVASGAEEYYWSPSIGMENSRYSSPLVKPDTSVTYRVIGMDSKSCFADTGYVPVVVYPYPAIEAGQDQTVPVGNQVTLNPVISKDVTSIRWRPSAGLSCVTCATPVAAPKQTTAYTVEAMNEGGCISRDNLTIFVFCNNANVFVPNTFSPNGDGNNDVFYPRGKGIFSIRSFKVFNRWGDLVFEQQNIRPNDISKGWTGLHKGQPASQDVYVYVMDIVCENNVILNYKGNVALIR